MTRWALGTVRIGEYDNGQWTTRASASVSESYNQWYDVRILTEGDAVTVWRGPKGGAMEQVAQCSGVGYTDSDRLWFQTNYWATYDVDDIVAVGGSMGATTTTFTYTDANELATQTVNGVTTAFTYDAWGRMVEKAVQGGPSAAYEYRYGDKLYSVASTFPGEGTVQYDYDGQGRRRSRTAGGVTTKYRWDAGWNLLNEETAAGVLAETYVYADPRAEVATLLAQVAGATPGAGAYDHYVHDHLGSTRGVFDASKALLSDFEYTPYGTQYAQAGGIALPELPGAFTAKPFEAAAGMYAFPYRMYAPGFGRWLTRDPLGMVDGPNVYGYVRGNPAGRIDPLGKDPVSLIAVSTAAMVMLCASWVIAYVGQTLECCSRKRCFWKTERVAVFPPVYIKIGPGGMYPYGSSVTVTTPAWHVDYGALEGCLKESLDNPLPYYGLPESGHWDNMADAMRTMCGALGVGRLAGAVAGSLLAGRVQLAQYYSKVTEVVAGVIASVGLAFSD